MSDREQKPTWKIATLISLVWFCLFFIVALFVGSIHMFIEYLGVSLLKEGNVQGEILYSIIAALAAVISFKWLLKFKTKKRYISVGGDEKVTWGMAARFSWSWFWRSAIIQIALMILLYIIITVLSISIDSFLSNGYILSAVFIYMYVLPTVIVMKKLLNTDYKTFKIRVLER